VKFPNYIVVLRAKWPSLAVLRFDAGIAGSECGENGPNFKFLDEMALKKEETNAESMTR
jgi:hypothetical protein